jgi:hypothetical protein
MKRLILECSAIALFAGGIYCWKHRPQPGPAPAIRGPMPDLAMPAPSSRPRAAGIEDSMLVKKEDVGDDRPHLAGKAVKPRALGDKPRLFDRAPLPPEAGPANVVLDEEKPGWQDELRRPRALAAVFCVFVVVFGILSRTLWRGRRGGFTHD